VHIQHVFAYGGGRCAYVVSTEPDGQQIRQRRPLHGWMMSRQQRLDLVNQTTNRLNVCLVHDVTSATDEA
jgi:hypothetical protein